MAPISRIRVLILCDTFVLHSDFFDPAIAIFEPMFHVFVGNRKPTRPNVDNFPVIQKMVERLGVIWF